MPDRSNEAPSLTWPEVGTVRTGVSATGSKGTGTAGPADDAASPGSTLLATTDRLTEVSSLAVTCRPASCAEVSVMEPELVSSGPSVFDSDTSDVKPEIV